MSYPYRYAPDCKVIGAAASALVNHMNRDAVIDSLETHGLVEIEPEAWYPADKFVNVFKDWIESDPSGVSSNLVSVGLAIIENMVLPPDMETMSQREKLLMVGTLHELQHSGGDPGGYEIFEVGPQHIQYNTNTIYPDDMIYGYIYGIARRYLDSGTRFTVRYDPDVPRQEKGGTQTIIHLTW